MLVVSAAGVLPGQGPTLRPGVRVRINGGQLVGTFVALHRDSLLLARGPRDSIALLVSSIAELDTAATTPRHRVARAALFGGAIGVIGGFAVITILNAHPSDLVNERALQVGVSAAGAVVGAMTGAILSVLRHGERWERVAHFS